MRFWKGRRRPVAIGDRVGYVKDPSEYGPMVVTEVTFRGWVWCDDREGVRTGPFRPDELDDADKFWTTSQAGLPS